MKCMDGVDIPETAMTTRAPVVRTKWPSMRKRKWQPSWPILGSHFVANLSFLPLSMTAAEERASSLATYHLPTMSRCPCMPASLSSRRSLANLYHHHHRPKRHLPSGVNICTMHYLMSTTSFMSSSSLMLSTTL